MTIHHSPEFQQSLVKKLLLSGLSTRQFSEQEGIPLSTLYGWKKQLGPESSESHAGSKNAEEWSPAQKFATVLATAALGELELGEYCRSNGIYAEQVKAWKAACVQGTMTNKEQKRAALAEAKSDKKRIRELERELRRKDKALAEAAALLILRKNLNALWEQDGED